MAELTHVDWYFHHLMQADAAVRPALIEAWRRTDPVLGEHLTAMLADFLRPEAESDPASEQRLAG